MLFSVGQDDRISVLKNAYSRECFNKAKDLAYTIIKLRNLGLASSEKIAELKAEIRDTLKDTVYTTDAKQAEDGIQKVFDEAVKP
jgi:hypothetical protein